VRQGAVAIKSFSTWAGHAGIWWRIYENMPPKSPGGQITSDWRNHCQVPEWKIFCFAEMMIGRITHPSRPAGGAFRDRHDTWAWDAMDAAASGVLHRTKTLAAYGEVVWSWRRDPGVYPPRLCGCGNGDNKGRSPGRARISRKAIARGKPGCLGCTCQTRVRSFATFSTRQCGRSRRPAFPAPSDLRGAMRLQNSGANCVARTSPLVIPGRRIAASPESITTGHRCCEESR
jgi:hypothetical protein